MSDADLVRALAARNRAGDLDAIPVEQEDPRPFLQRLKDALVSGGWQDPVPGQRGTFVPSRINEQGKAEPAVPGIIQQPAESLQSLMTAPLSDIVRSGDRDAIRAASEASFDVAGALPAAGAAIGRTVPNNAAGIFGGRLAKTADQAALKRAEDMTAKGAPREDIWRDTGWFQGVDGKWRFEIDDSKAAIKYPAGDVAREVAQVMGVTGDMKDIFSHPNAYAAYPDAATIPGDIGLFRRGTYYREPGIGGEMISVSAKDADRVPHTLHEFQHAIQNREKFGRGGNPAALREQLQGSIPDGWLRNDVLSEAYKRLAGEVESRAVETRANLTQDERRARPPWLDYDVPESQQIVKFSSNPDDPTSAAVTSALTAHERPKGITAYHGGSPNLEGGRLSTKYAGSGAGNETYMDGLHFSTDRGVAGDYKNQFGALYETRLNADPGDFVQTWGPFKGSRFEGVLTGLGMREMPNRLYPDRPGTVADAWSDYLKRQRKIGRSDIEINTAVADALREAGAKGSFEGGGHYVVNDDSIIEIVRRLASNPDDPNTAAILAAMTGLDQPGRMTPEDALKATTRRPANLNEPGLAQLEPGPQDTASFKGFQQGEVKPLYEYDPSKWDKTGSRERAPGQPPQDVAENLFPHLAAKAKDTWDVIDAAQPILARMRDTYGASVQQGISDLPKETAARMLQTVFDGVKGAGTPDAPDAFVTQRYSVRLIPMAEKAAWMADGSGTTLMVGTKATASDVTSAIKSRIAKDGKWKPFDGVYANPNDPTTAAILALLTAQQGGQPQQ